MACVLEISEWRSVPICCVLFVNLRSKATAVVLVNAPLIKFRNCCKSIQPKSTFTKVQLLICIILLP